MLCNIITKACGLQKDIHQNHCRGSWSDHSIHSGATLFRYFYQVTVSQYSYSTKSNNIKSICRKINEILITILIKILFFHKSCIYICRQISPIPVCHFLPSRFFANSTGLFKEKNGFTFISTHATPQTAVVIGLCSELLHTCCE